MTSLETQRSNEELADIQALTKPDDVSDKLLADTTLPPSKVFSQEMALGFLSLAPLGGDKKAKKEITNLDRESPVRKLAEKYIALDLRPGAALAQAKAREAINSLSDKQKKVAQQALTDGYLPTAALAQGARFEENTEPTTVDMIRNKAQDYRWVFNETNKTFYAPNDHSYQVIVNENDLGATLHELDMTNRVYHLAQTYTTDSGVRSLVDAVRNDRPLTGNETDLMKRMTMSNEQGFYAILCYARVADQLGDVDEEDIKSLGEELTALDTIYGLPQKYREPAVKSIERGQSPANALHQAIDQTIMNNLNSKSKGEDVQTIVNNIKLLAM